MNVEELEAELLKLRIERDAWVAERVAILAENHALREEAESARAVMRGAAMKQLIGRRQARRRQLPSPDASEDEDSGPAGIHDRIRDLVAEQFSLAADENVPNYD